MRAVFVELPPFERCRSSYLDDEGFRNLQLDLLRHPTAGDLIPGTGGLRKARWTDPKRGQGKRGGLRVIYFWWESRDQFWLFTLYSKGEMSDLDPDERQILKNLLKRELEARS